MDSYWQTTEPVLTPVGIDSMQAALPRRRNQLHNSPARIYGSPTDPTAADVQLEMGDFQLDLYKGFTGNADRTVMGGRLHWTKPLVVPRDRIFCLHLFVDVSGSMGSPLSGSGRSRSRIISDSMRQLSDIILPLIEKGLQFQLSLHTFSNECKQVFPLTPVTREWMESTDWDKHFEPTYMTNLWGAAKVAKEMRANESDISTESTYILMSDGMDTVGDEPLEEAVFDVAIGIGTSRDYDPHILRTLSQTDIEACPDETALSSTLLRYGCKSYMNLATNVELHLGGGSLIKNLDTWMSGSQILIYWDIPMQRRWHDITLQYTDTDSDVKQVKVTLDRNKFPTRSARASRLVVDACRMQQESTDRLETEGDSLTMDTILPILIRIEMLRGKFTTTSWMFTVLDGLWNTWNTIKDTIFTLPLLDRGLSIHSAARQTQANYYNSNCEVLARNYSTQAQ